MMPAEGKASRKRVIGVSAAAAAGIAAATAGIIGYTRRHRHHEAEIEMPIAHETMPVQHGD